LESAIIRSPQNNRHLKWVTKLSALQVKVQFEEGKKNVIKCRDWDEVLPSALWALRTTKNKKTGFSSFELLYGRRDKQPFELLVNLDRQKPNETREEYILRKFLIHRK